MKWIIRILVSIITLLLLVLLAIYLYMVNDAKIPYGKPDPMLVVVPTFKELNLDFNHHFVTEKHLPVAGSGIIDMDGDGTPEVWFGGGRDQDDAIFKYKEGAFADITKGSGFEDKNPQTQSYGPHVMIWTVMEMRIC